MVTGRLPVTYYLAKRVLVSAIRSRISPYLDRSARKTLIRSHELPTGDCLFIYEQECPSKMYRVDHAAHALKKFGFRCRFLRYDHLDILKDYQVFSDYRLVVLHRLAAKHSLDRALKAFANLGIPVIFDTDDCIFNEKIYRHSAIFDRLNPLETRLHSICARNTLRTLKRCDAVTVSTVPLAEAASEYHPVIHLIQNCVSEQMVERFEASSGRTQTKHPNEIRLAYMSGTSTHDRDLAVIETALKTIMERNRTIHLTLAGPVSCPASLRVFYPNRISIQEFIPFEEMPRLYADIDISLAPLELNNPFCRCKSPIKFFESALARKPVLASPIPAFCDVMENGRTGFLPKDTSEWIEQIEYLVEKAEARNSIGMASFESVRRNHTIDRRKNDWQIIMRQMGIRHENSAGSAPFSA